MTELVSTGLKTKKYAKELFPKGKVPEGKVK
jgi:hypothetical protein